MAMWPTDGAPQVAVTVLFKVYGGRPEPVSVTVDLFRDANANPRITADLFRRLPMGALVDAARKDARRSTAAAVPGFDPSTMAVGEHIELLEQLDPRHPAAPAEIPRSVADWERLIEKAVVFHFLEKEETEPARRGRPPMYGPEHWRQVATVYAESYQSGSGTPTQEVADKFKVSKSTAAKWVHRCREMGLLNPTSKGKPGGILTDGGDN